MVVCVLACSKFALVKIEPSKFVPSKLARSKFAPVKSAPLRLASFKFARLKLESFKLEKRNTDSFSFTASKLQLINDFNVNCFFLKKVHPLKSILLNVFLLSTSSNVILQFIII